VADAIILQFPQRARAETAQDRLHRALTELHDALLIQKRVLADWRLSLAELGIGAAALSQALHRSQDNLGSVHARVVGCLPEDARQLEHQADSVLRPTNAAGFATV
jgi:hypothetical protein